MDITSFVLGICAVLVIVAAVLGVVAFFGQKDLRERTINSNSDLKERINAIEQWMHSQFDDIYRQLDKEVTEINRTVDSRTDKASEKLMKELESVKHEFAKLAGLK